ncbi:MAG: UbiA prenyltransferase family protein [Promethearchaeota archaeon]
MLKKIKNILNLLRVRQFYKNTLIFWAAFFSKNLLDFSLYPTLIVGFILLCCASSINYIINDIRDIEKDRAIKLDKRPLASGELSVKFAILVIILLSGIIIFSLIFIIQNVNFSIMIILILVTGQLYNHFFKRYAFIDILSLSLIYLWRALAGCFLIEVFISPWLFLAIFEIALFLVVAKRKGDLISLGGENASKHRKSYKKYDINILTQFQNMISSSLFITYSIYLILHFGLFQAENINIHEYIAILTIPTFLYIILRYIYLTTSKPEIARNTEKAFFDKGIIIAGISLIAILSYSYYWKAIFLILETWFNKL